MHSNQISLMRLNKTYTVCNLSSIYYHLKLPATVLFFLILITLPQQSKAQAISPQTLFLNMVSAINKVQTARYQLVLNERIKNEYKLNKYLTKVQVHPFKVYTYSINSNPGAEVLYIEGENNNEAVVNPNKFPWMNLNLKPENMLIRKGHLFSLDKAGFSYLSQVLQHHFNADRTKFNSSLKLLADTIFNGKPCYRLMLFYPEYKWYVYTVKKSETFTSIANRLYLNDYLMMERNGKTNFNDLRAGDKIFLPNMFAKKIVLSIDKATLLPVNQVLYDDKGMFAAIEFRNLIVNQPIPAEEFTTSYKDYGF